MSFASARLIDHLHTIPQPSDDGWLAKARPGLLASCPQDLLIFGFQYAFDQAHVVLLAFRGPKARTAERIAVLTHTSTAAYTRLVTAMPSGVTTYSSRASSPTSVSTAASDSDSRKDT